MRFPLAGIPRYRAKVTLVSEKTVTRLVTGCSVSLCRPVAGLEVTSEFGR